MSFIRFWNVCKLTLPPSPGATDTNFIIQGTDWGWSGNADFMGIRFPWFQEGTQFNPDVGVSPESNLLITRYRYSVIGAEGLRAGIVNPYINGLQIQMGREVQRQGGLLIPLVKVGEWEDTDLLWSISSISSREFHVPQHLGSSLYFDTTNLQSIYYDREVSLLFEMDGQATLIEGA